MVVAKIRERLVVSKQASPKLDGKRFNLRKLNELVVRKEYQMQIANRSAALENLSNVDYINRLGRTLNTISKPQPQRV
jgi:hypothetical protein